MHSNLREMGGRIFSAFTADKWRKSFQPLTNNVVTLGSANKQLREFWVSIAEDDIFRTLERMQSIWS